MEKYAFSFLEEDFKKIAKYSKDAEKLIVNGMEDHAILIIGQVAEMIAKKICTLKGLKQLIKDENGKFVTQFDRISALSDKKIITNKIFHWFYDILKRRNSYSHQEEDKKLKNSLKLAKILHKQLFKIAQWFSYEFADNLRAKNLDYPGIIYKNESELPSNLKMVDIKIDSLIKDIKTKDIELKSKKSLTKNEEKAKKELKKLTDELLSIKNKIHNDEFELLESQQSELIQDVGRMKKNIEQITKNSNIDYIEDEYLKLMSLIDEIHNEMKEIFEKTENEDIKAENLKILKNIEEIEKNINYSPKKDINLIKEENKIIMTKIKNIENKINESLIKTEKNNKITQFDSINEKLNYIEKTYRKYYPASLENIKKIDNEFIVFKENEEFGRYDDVNDAIKARDELKFNNWAFINEIKEVSKFIYQLNRKYIIKAKINDEERVFGIFDNLNTAKKAKNEAMKKAWQIKYIPLNKFNLNEKYDFDLK